MFLNQSEKKIVPAINLRCHKNARSQISVNSVWFFSI